MWIRRILAIPLIILFFVFFTVALFVTQVNDKLDDTGFYNHHTEKADVYNFFYDEVLPAALDEVEDDDTSGDIPIKLSPIQDELISAAKSILPPEWLQEQFVAAIDASLPYFMGSTDEFTYTLPLRERVDTAATVIKDDILQGPAFTSVYDDMIDYIADQILDKLENLPYTLTLQKSELKESLEKALPEKWLASEFASVIDSVIPYFTDDSDHFTVAFDLKGRIDAIAEGTIEVLTGEETYEYVLDTLITPIVEDNIGITVDLPYGIILTQEEISTTIKKVMPQPWVDARMRDILNSIASYAKGEVDSIDLAIDLADQKTQAMEILGDLAGQKLESLFNGLPTCTPTEFASQLQAMSSRNLPDCRPSGVSYSQFKSALGTDIDAIIADAINQSISEEIPDQWTFSKEDLQESLGEENEDFLQTARDYVSDGWIFTEVDFLDELEPDDEDQLNDVRDWIGNDYTLTQEDIRDEISDEERDEEALEDFDDSRKSVDTFRTWLWAWWVLPIIFLIGIGFLAGQAWRGRSIWALGVLFGVSLVILISVSAAYSLGGESDIQDAIDQSDLNGVELVAAEKGQEIIGNIADDFVSAIKSDTIITMIFSFIFLFGIVGWSYYNGRRNSGAISDTSDTPDRIMVSE
ncbi:MAG: hypothetical protein HQ553_05370 [Chloroflexi bacterium]|nr:hypothetical protein [Chloroflexota bacterium]